jgi:hypothetical protein
VKKKRGRRVRVRKELIPEADLRESERDLKTLH